MFKGLETKNSLKNGLKMPFLKVLATNLATKKCLAKLKTHKSDPKHLKSD